jgi:hypothetical protein
LKPYHVTVDDYLNVVNSEQATKYKIQWAAVKGLTMAIETITVAANIPNEVSDPFKSDADATAD